MDRDQQLAAVLGEFARTMLTDFPIQAILDRLIERIVEVLPVSAAGVSLISGGARPQYLAASNSAALRLERLQTVLGEGPCVLANEGGVAVSVPDLATDARFPAFVGVAAQVGISAVFAFPMRHNEGQLGALDLFCEAPGPLDDWAMGAAQTLADVAAAYVLNAQAREESRAAAELLRASALHDALTGLPNRVMLQQRLDHAAERAQRSRAPAAVLFADLDGFKLVNDTYGHAVGDALLVAVAGRLSGLVRPGDTLARVSGDEFVILCEDLHSAEDVAVLAERIADAFHFPFAVQTRASLDDDGRKELRLTASVGVAFAGQANEIGPQLIEDADRAMYRAKRRGAKARVIALPDAGASELLALHDDLQVALDQGLLELAYQPIVRTVDGEMTGVEALLRWTHDDRGVVPAPIAVAVAEQGSLIVDLGRWVLERSMRDRMAWLTAHPGRPLELAVNVSARQLMSPGLRGTVARLLADNSMDPAALTLEVTESVLLDDTARAAGVLADLRELGVRLALDDFGTGYSSLSYLRQFPVDIVKIDQGFVAGIGVEPAGAAIVAAVTNLAHVLGLLVTAEGVETAAQRDEVLAFGCESAQGFHYARPMPALEIAGRLRAEPGAPLRLPLRTVS